MIFFALAAGGDPDTARGGTAFDERYPVELLWDLEEDAEGTAFMDALDWMRLHPVSLNDVTAEELLAIPGVTTADAAAIVSFRDRGGTFRTVEDLRTLPGGGEMLYDALRPFVCAGRREKEGVRVRDLVVCRSPGENGTIGPPVEVISRVTVEHRSGLEAGGALSRRAGERMEDALISGYAALAGIGGLTRAVAGDFDVEAGDGLVLWRGPSMPGEIGPVRVSSPCGIVPHRGSDRGHYLRGIAASAAFAPGWRGAFFLSERSYAASVDTSGDASAFFDGGYTTPSAASKRDALRETLAGLLVDCPLPGGAVAGLAAYSSRFDRTFVPSDPDRLKGSSTGAWGAHIAWSGSHVAARGELGVLHGGARAFSGTASLLSPSGESLVIRFCDIPSRYDNPHASSGGDWGATRNTRSFAAALHLPVTPASRGELRLEAFDHPAPTRECPIPRRGLELTLTGKAAFQGGARVTFRTALTRSYESTPGTDLLGRTVPTGGPASRIRTLVCVSAPAGAGFTVGERCECVCAGTPGGGALPGFLLGGEFAARLPLRGAIEGRLALFRTDGYDARLYDREEALPGVLSSPPLYGRGARWYVRLRMQPASRMSVTCRYAATLHDRAPRDSAALPPDSREIALQVDATL